MAAPELSFTPEEKSRLLGLARACLETAARGTGDDPLEAFLGKFPDGPWQRPLPCFVSLFTRSDRLRGCIGCLETEDPLARNVARMARLAAFEDPRFRPVGREELKDLVVHISVLGPLRPLPSLDAVELGRHGLLVRRFPRQGVLLAEVPAKFRWSKEEFLSQTFVKAGLDPADRAGAEIFYFEELEFSESP